jgi:mannitol-1-phosphate/altronate dehydrogenase
MDRVELTRANLARLPGSVAVPNYDTAQVRAGIVHLGLGGFHRAHMARYTHDLMQRQPDGLGWGIVGAGLTAADRRMRDSLVPQDKLYTLVERDSDHQSITVIGSLADVVFAAEDSSALLAAMDHSDIRIVSLTVTEHGYCLNRATKRLDPEHPLIKKDLAEPDRPASAIGIVVESLRRRRAAGIAPFTALSCDNIQHNGTVLRDATLALATLRDSALATWIEAHVSFPSTMVDRITPVTADSDITWLEAQTGLVDRWPVFCETFTQWVIEDRFPLGRPAWETVGAQFVADVAPYEFMKLRLLNTSHLAVAGLGRLAGYVTIDEAMGDDDIARYMRALMDRETGPTLPAVPGIDLAAYKATLLTRFANVSIKDTVERVNTDAPLNILVDPIRDRLARGQSIDLLALALAAWLRRIRGEDETGQPIIIKHPLAEALRAKAIEGGADPRPLLNMADLFGETGRDTRLIGPVGHWLAMLYDAGARKTVAEAARALGF